MCGVAIAGSCRILLRQPPTMLEPEQPLFISPTRLQHLVGGSVECIRWARKVAAMIFPATLLLCWCLTCSHSPAPFLPAVQRRSLMPLTALYSCLQTHWLSMLALPILLFKGYFVITLGFYHRASFTLSDSALFKTLVVPFVALCGFRDAFSHPSAAFVIRSRFLTR